MYVHVKVKMLPPTAFDIEFGSEKNETLHKAAAFDSSETAT